MKSGSSSSYRAAGALGPQDPEHYDQESKSELIKELLGQCSVFYIVLQWKSVKDALGMTDHAAILKNLNAVLDKAQGGQHLR